VVVVVVVIIISVVVIVVSSLQFEGSCVLAACAGVTAKFLCLLTAVRVAARVLRCGE